MVPSQPGGSVEWTAGVSVDAMWGVCTAAADAGDEDPVRRRGVERAQHQPDRRELSTTQLLPARRPRHAQTARPQRTHARASHSHVDTWPPCDVGEGMDRRDGTGSHFVTQRPSDPGIQRPGDPVDPVTLFYNEV